jgi:hypothetical protein
MSGIRTAVLGAEELAPHESGHVALVRASPKAMRKVRGGSLLAKEAAARGGTLVVFDQASVAVGEA